FKTYVVSDATATFDNVGPDGTRYGAELLHNVALADLHGEFATVVDTATIYKVWETAGDRALEHRSLRRLALGRDPRRRIRCGIVMRMVCDASSTLKLSRPARESRRRHWWLTRHRRRDVPPAGREWRGRGGSTAGTARPFA